MVPAPTIALLEARSLVALGRLVLARKAYERAAFTPLTRNAPEAFEEASRTARAELADLDRRIPRFRVLILGEWSESSPRVSLDGRVLPPSSIGTFLRVDPGPHELEAGNGDAARSVAFELREGESRTIRIDGGTKADPALTAGIVALGTGAAGLALGITTGVLALDAHREAERRCPNGACVRGTAGADALDRFRTHRTLSTIGYAIGAAGVGTGAALLLTSAGASEPSVTVVSGLHEIRVEASF